MMTRCLPSGTRCARASSPGRVSPVTASSGPSCSKTPSIATSTAGNRPSISGRVSLDGEERRPLRQSRQGLTLPELKDFYAELVNHPNVLRVFALSGGYTRNEANARLAPNHGVGRELLTGPHRKPLGPAERQGIRLRSKRLDRQYLRGIDHLSAPPTSPRSWASRYILIAAMRNRDRPVTVGSAGAYSGDSEPFHGGHMPTGRGSDREHRAGRSRERDRRTPRRVASTCGEAAQRADNRR
jgi:hypothetical protein